MDQENSRIYSAQTTRLWYVLRCKPNMEATVWNQLLEKGIETYYPRLSVKPVNPRSRTQVPFFPGYLFVRGTLPALYASKVGLLPGAQALVAFDGLPASVPDVLISAVRQQVERENQLAAAPAAGLASGDPVWVEQFPMGGFKGLFDRCLNGKQRVLVLMEILSGQKIRVEVPAAAVRPLAARRRVARG